MRIGCHSSAAILLSVTSRSVTAKETNRLTWAVKDDTHPAANVTIAADDSCVAEECSSSPWNVSSASPASTLTKQSELTPIRQYEDHVPNKIHTSQLLHEVNSKSKVLEEDSYLHPHQCGLYLAPSTLPYAGLGLFLGTSIPSFQSANEYLSGTFPGYNDFRDPPLWKDLYIPIDDHFKTLPYRGQTRFPSWLAYVWPRERGAFHHEAEGSAFPEFPDEIKGFDEGLNHADGISFYMDDYENDYQAQEAMQRRDDEEWQPKHQVSALAPGLASLMNSHHKLHNLDRIYQNSRVHYEGMVAPWQPGAGAFTPHHSVEFHTTKQVWAGMELILDYGQTWNSKHATMMKKVNHRKRSNAGVYHSQRERQGFIEGIDTKWDVLDERETFNCPEELPTEKGKRDRIAIGMAVDSSELKGGRPYSEYRFNTFHPFGNVSELPSNSEPSSSIVGPTSPKNITRSLSWLGNYGVCLSSGKLRVGSSLIPSAGRGVFATSHIRKGEVVLPSPLLALRREDLKIYKFKPTRLIGEELLVNYAFGDEQSPMLLVPIAPLANFINHGGPQVSEKPNSEGANVQIRWPEKNSNAAKLFAWAYRRRMFENEDENNYQNEIDAHNPWLMDHPIDVMERSGKLGLEYVALRDIHNGEEILIDYGNLWDAAWKDFSTTSPYSRAGYFRHSIGVPSGFYPDNWIGVNDKYEIAEIKDLKNKPLEVGKVLPMTWSHNGKPVSSKYAYVVGLPKGFSDRFLEYSKQEGIIEMYKKLLTEQEGYHLPSDGFAVYEPRTLVTDDSSVATNSSSNSNLEFFAHRYHSDQYLFNMHFVSAWNEEARKSVLAALGDAGFDAALNGIGERFGYDNLTCFHASYMGVTHCNKSRMHSDIYATNDKSWNIVFPLITVDGTSPELDILSEDMNTVIGVHYLKDVAYVIGDFGYHQTRPIDYYDPAVGTVGETWKAASSSGMPPIRVVFGAYCSQIDETNVAMMRHVYDGDDPAPFADQFAELPMKEIHWDRIEAKASLAKPLGEGYVTYV